MQNRVATPIDRSQLQHVKRLVIKVGSALLTDPIKATPTAVFFALRILFLASFSPAAPALMGRRRLA